MKKNEINMTEGPLIKNMLLFSIPIVLSVILQTLFGVADASVVGHFAGKEAMAAVGASSSVISLIVGGAVSLATGTGVILAHLFGKKDKENIIKTIHTASIMSVVLGIIIAIISIIFTRKILQLTKCPSDIINDAVKYFAIYLAGLPCLLLYNIGTSVAQSVGDTKHPLLYEVIAGVLNLILNLIFVIIFHMDTVGVALATVISQIVSAVLLWRYIYKRKDLFGVEKANIGFSTTQLKEILKLGVPSALNSIVMSLSVVIIQRAINGFGTVTVSANTAAGSIEGVMAVAIIGFNQACTMFIGQNYGAGNFDRIRKVWKVGLVGGIVVGEVLGVILYLCSGYVLHIFTNDPEVIAVAIIRMKYICLFYALCVSMNVSGGCVYGLKSAKAPMVVSILGSCVFRITWIYTYAASVGTLESIYMSYPICWIITTVGNLICFEVFFRKHKNEYLASVK